MKSHRFIIYLFVGFLILQSCKEESKKVIKTEPVVFTKEGELQIFNMETDSILTKIDIEIAETSYETETGLMYRKGMEEHQGMLFIFEDVRLHNFYMKNTEFPLDIVYVKDNMTIASFQENAQPLDEKSLPSKVPVQYVLELNAGLVQKWGLKVGDSIAFNRL
ncbi:DUF192 domain-containing protein [Ulvibacterium marinum]|uniref:DUF192 domain-containing protein n=1 Tax=Ulvibacterium marinum TaxID=2419782 RepID=A0A3B0C550_9FLAO|nr:DUF192 domain-containing protein [Ulvibacterium marinum]RKN79881.1 DUF192 domain-containing protein [Ulvibacterium marinum]